MAVSCDPAQLAAASASFQKLSDRDLVVVQCYLLQQAANNMQTPAQILAAAYAAGYGKINDRDLMMCLVYQLCLANGGS